VCGEDGGFEQLVDFHHPQDPAFRGGFARDVDEGLVFSLAVKARELGYRNPFSRSGPSFGIEIFRIVFAILRCLEGKLHTGGRGFDAAYLEFRVGMGLDPEKSAYAEARDQEKAGENGP
jgi:hypothetical protein